jgi:hypothetical protein
VTDTKFPGKFLPRKTEYMPKILYRRSIL